MNNIQSIANSKAKIKSRVKGIFPKRTGLMSSQPIKLRLREVNRAIFPSYLFKTTQQVETQIIPSKIIEINSEKVVCECLIHTKNQVFELREFPVILFKNYKGLVKGTVFQLNIYQTASNLSLHINHLGDKSIEKLFDTSELFEGLEELNVHYQ